MCLIYHRNVICAISDRCSDYLVVSLFYHFDKVGFLTWADTTANHSITALRQFTQLFLSDFT